MSSQTLAFLSATEAMNAPGNVDLVPAKVSSGTRMWRTLRAWRARAKQRAELAGFDDHRLDDIGVSRAEAGREAVKPFWRA